MNSDSTMRDPGTDFDEATEQFLATEFDQMPEGVSEALSGAGHTVLVSRDPLRPNTHWCVNVLRNGILLAASTPPTDDLTLAVSKACAMIRDVVVTTFRENRKQAGFVNLA